MNPITFRVFGEPKAQPRPRAFAKKFGQTFSARVYDPGTAEGWKSLIAAEVRHVLPASPLAGPIRLDATFLFDRPKRLLTKKSPHGRIRHTGRPDRDNLDKSLLDCLTQIGFLSDDSIVTDGEIRKRYVAIGERAGVIVTISRVSVVDEESGQSNPIVITSPDAKREEDSRRDRDRVLPPNGQCASSGSRDGAGALRPVQSGGGALPQGVERPVRPRPECRRNPGTGESLPPACHRISQVDEAQGRVAPAPTVHPLHSVAGGLSCLPNGGTK